MAKESKKRRQFIIKLKRKRKQKIKKLIEKYKAEENKEKKEKIIEKALKINPNLTKEDFLKLIK